MNHKVFAIGHSVYRIAETLGKGRMTVKHHLEEPETIVKVEDERAQLVQIYKDKARLCALGVTEEKVSKGTALQLATASAIFTDKALLLSGQPTSIHVHALVEVLDILRERRDQEEERQHELDRAAYQEAKAAKALLNLLANSVVS